MVKYDVYITHTREDADYAIKLAKSLEQKNISVFYGQTAKQGKSICDTLDEGCSLLGIVLISRSLLIQHDTESDLNNLCERLVSPPHNTLHVVWLNGLGEEDVRSYNEYLANIPAIHSPPETPESIARIIQVKLAGSSKLQVDTLVGYHTKQQYISPAVTTYRNNPALAEVERIRSQHSKQEQAPAEQKAPLTFAEDIEQTQGLVYDEHMDCFQRYKDEPISRILDEEAHTRIVQRLGKYLTHLKNWKDMAMAFSLDTKEMSQHTQPAAYLLHVLLQQGVTVDEFCQAAVKIDRVDVTDDVMRSIYRSENIPIPYLYPRDSVEKV